MSRPAGTGDRPRSGDHDQHPRSRSETAADKKYGDNSSTLGRPPPRPTPLHTKNLSPAALLPSPAAKLLHRRQNSLAGGNTPSTAAKLLLRRRRNSFTGGKTPSPAAKLLRRRQNSFFAGGKTPSPAAKLLRRRQNSIAGGNTPSPAAKLLRRRQNSFLLSLAPPPLLLRWPGADCRTPKNTTKKKEGGRRKERE